MAWTKHALKHNMHTQQHALDAGCTRSPLQSLVIFFACTWFSPPCPIGCLSPAGLIDLLRSFDRSRALAASELEQTMVATCNDDVVRWATAFLCVKCYSTVQWVIAILAPGCWLVRACVATGLHWCAVCCVTVQALVHAWQTRLHTSQLIVANTKVIHIVCSSSALQLLGTLLQSGGAWQHAARACCQRYVRAAAATIVKPTMEAKLCHSLDGRWQYERGMMFSKRDCIPICTVFLHRTLAKI